MQNLLDIFIQMAKQLEYVQLIDREVETIMESSNEGIMVMDSRGCVVRINKAFEIIAGLDSAQVLDRHIEELAESGIVELDFYRSAIKARKTVTARYSYQNGQQAVISYCPYFDAEGAVAGVVVNIQEIKGMAKMPEELLLTHENKVFSDSANADLLNHRDILETVIAKSKAMTDVLEAGRNVAQLGSNVLLLGKQGVGKETVARYIHACGRSTGRFIKFNNDAIPAGLLESLMFGCFAANKRSNDNTAGKGIPGSISAAGTLFIEEVGDLPAELQEKLCILIDEYYQRDLRIVAASAKNLKHLVNQGRLTQRLLDTCPVAIHIPPLKKRKEDIPFLIQHYTRLFNNNYRLKKSWSSRALELLSDYEWPENVRELVDLVERLVATVEESVITPKYLPGYVFKSVRSQGTTNNIKPLKEAVAELEFELIKNAVDAYGSTYKAADVLGVSQPTVVRKLQKYSNVKKMFKMLSVTPVK